MTTDSFAVIAGAVIAIAYVGLIFLLRAVVTRRPVLPPLVATIVGSVGWPALLPRTGIDRFVGFWLSAAVFLAVAWVIRVAKARKVVR